MSKGKRVKNNKKDVSQRRKQDNEADRREKEKCEECETKTTFTLDGETLNAIFRSDELHELRKILDTKDLSEMPMVLGAVILGKFDVVKKLLKEGHHIDDFGLDHSTPVMWAVKNKKLEMIDLLLARGADVTMVDENGDNAFLLAVDSAAWDEHDFIDFWNTVKDTKRFNINYSNKAGNTMLHFAVKRQWPILVEALLESKINVNCANTKGVTPLMMAGARNNSRLVSMLLRTGADVTREDDRGCTALCYAIAYIILKRLEPPNSALERLIAAINAEETVLTTEEYLRRRLDLIISSTREQKSTFAHVITTVILPVITFFVRNIQGGLEMLLDLRVFAKLREATEKHLDNPQYVNTILACLFELVRYCDCCMGAGVSCISEVKLMDNFIINGGADLCLWILKRHGSMANNSWLITASLMPLFVSCPTEGRPRVWLQLHYQALTPYYQQFLDMCVVSLNFLADEYHIKLVKRKMRLFRKLFKKLQNGENICAQQQIKKFTITAGKQQFNSFLKDPTSPTNSSEQAPKNEPHATEQSRKLVTLDEYMANQEKQRAEMKSNSKRMKRKTKAWKAKVAKIRSADVAERVTAKPDIIQSSENMDAQTSQTGDQLKYMAQELDVCRNIEPSYIEPVKSKDVLTWPGDSAWDLMRKFRYKKGHLLDEATYGEDTIKIDIKLEQDSSSEGAVSEVESDNGLPTQNSSTATNSPQMRIDDSVSNIETFLSPTIRYLTSLFEDIMLRYERNWRRDRELGYPDFRGGQCDNSDSIFVGPREEQIELLSEILPQMEAEYLSRLRDKFMELIARIKQIALERDSRYQKMVEQLEMTLLNHEVRGETALTHGVEKKAYVELIENLRSEKYWQENNYSRKPYNYNSAGMEAFLREQEEEYVKRMIFISKTRKLRSQEELDAIKRKTEESAYHLIDSVEKLLESSSPASSRDESESEHTFDELFPYSTEAALDETLQPFKSTKPCFEEGQTCSETTNSSKQKNQEVCASNFFNILSHGKAKRTKTAEDTTEVCNNLASSAVSTSFKQSAVISSPVNTFWKHALSMPVPDQQSYVSRWDVAITGLRNFKNLNVLACGELRTSPQTARLHFMVSSGGNFGDVELGLDIHGRALAVKRISKKNNTVCKILKAAMNPLLGLRHKHLLHYAVCEYDDTQLLMASPLCEYNMGEYLMCLKLNHSLINTATSLARQMLVGLRYLHDRSSPIVHGNLKPSNVLIDSQGILKLAEFGVYRALYQSVRPPKSSIIWFARETYEHYEKTSIMSCTTYSDIQVAGMLLHFILTGGLHPFGIVAEDILENIVRGTSDLKTVGCELVDLVSWMLIYEPSDRPNVMQILSHVYFWDSERKWRFLLACAGITQHGSPMPVSLNHLHSSLDASAARDHIKGDWVSVVKAKYPGMRLAEGTFSDTPTGLLRFLRACTEERQLNSRSFGGIDLQAFFIEAFPALPLSLFRLLETSEWLKHPVFTPFTIATS